MMPRGAAQARTVRSEAADRRASPARNRDPASRRIRLPDLLIGLGFAAFLLVQIARHAMWRDELNAWGIVLDSDGLGSLFAHMHYEGHPGLWHLLLWLASSVSADPRTLQILHAGIAVGIVGMVALVSPFGRIEKILILLGYFILFDYTVVSRNYGLGLLLALVYAERRGRHPEQTLRNAVLLGLLANTNVFALILAGGLALEYAWARRTAQAGVAAWLAALAWPAATLLAMTAFSVATFWPAADISWRTTGRPLANGLSLAEVAHVLTNNLSALVPLDVQSFWYSEQGPAAYFYPQLRLAILASAPLLLLVFLRLFAGAPRLLVIPAVTLVGSVAFNLVFYQGFVRHWGINLVAVLAALWILRASQPQRTPWAMPLLALNAVAGVLFTVQHWSIPFSNAGATAAWIEGAGLREAALIGTPDTHAAAVAELLGRPMTFLDCRCTDTYLAYHRRRDDFAKADIPERLLSAVTAQAGRRIVYIDTEPATAAAAAALAAKGLSLVRRAAFTGAMNENFYIYEIVSGTGTSGPGAAATP